MQREEYAKMMDICIERTHHIHARIGYSQGLQVPDLQVGEELIWTELFEGCWDRIVEHQKARAAHL